MPLDANSLAAGVGAAVKNVQFISGASNVPRKIVVIGTYDPAITTVVDEVPKQVLSPEDGGSQFGFGFMLHRLLMGAFDGSLGVECWVVPQAEVAGTAAAGDIDFSGAATASGTLWLFIANQLVAVSVAKGDTDTDVCANAVAAINADITLPVTAAVNGVDDTIADITSKPKGPWGDEITITFNWEFNQELPAGITVVVTDMTGGAGIPDIADALDGLGTGDAANELNFTDGVHGYGNDPGTLDDLSVYNGEGNDFVGLYKKTVSRPFRFMSGDNVAESAGLIAAKALGDGRKADRTNGLISVPGSPSHPSEIGAVAVGIMARINNNRVAEHFVGKILTGIRPGATADRWTNEYDNRDSAVRSGVSPTEVRSNTVYMSDVLSFYHPDNVPVKNNGYRHMVNIAKTQNILFNNRLNFSQEKWQGFFIVASIAKVTSTEDRKKARDRGAVLDDVLSLTKAYEGKGWLFSANFTIERLQSDASLISIRPGGDGFTITMPVIYSGVGGILDTVVEFDTSLTIVLG